MAAVNTIIELQETQKYFPVTSGAILKKVTGQVKAVDGVSFKINEGETYSLVGESGCGKTTTAKMVLQVEKPTGGMIRFNGNDMDTFTRDQRKEYRASIQAVFQDPWSSLNPRMKVGNIIMEPLLANQEIPKGEIRERTEKLLNDVGLHTFQADYYPHEFSGGQRQRIAIARALSLQPKVIVLDEPVSALDVSIRAQIMNLLKQLQDQYGVSYLLIAHQLATVRYMSHHVGVMYLGKMVEEGLTKKVFDNPRHPYTRALIEASLPAHPDSQREGFMLEVEVPSPLNPPQGCSFHPRCPNPTKECAEGSMEMGLIEVEEGHRVDRCCVNCG